MTIQILAFGKVGSEHNLENLRCIIGNGGTHSNLLLVENNYKVNVTVRGNSCSRDGVVIAVVGIFHGAFTTPENDRGCRGVLRTTTILEMPRVESIELCKRTTQNQTWNF